MPALSPGKRAPSFELKNVKGEKSGTPGLKPGEVAVLTFFKETCPTCQYAFPFLEKLYRHHQNDSKVKFLAVAQEDKSGAEKFIDEYDITMPMALDSSPYSVSSKFALTHVPTVFLLKDDGTIEQTTVGFVKKEYEELAGKLATISGKKPAHMFQGVTVPELKPG